MIVRQPRYSKEKFAHRAAEIEYPIKAVVEMEIAIFLDMEALGFVDRKPGRGQ
jgi:hypothetical protein